MSTSRPRIDSIRSSSTIDHSAWGARAPSPSFSTTTTGSKVNLPENHALITRKDLRQSIACFEELMAAAKAYRNALLAMSSATAAFATAMEACSRVKGCRSSNSALAGAGGLQYLVSNHEQLLADTVYRQFEIPLLHALDNYKMITADRLAAYEKALHEQSQKIRKTEAENLKIGRRRKRDLQQFRQALGELQRQVDELDSIKAAYHEEVLEGEEEVWETVLGRVAFVIRSQLDFYEKIAGKASDPILEPMVMSIPDPFDAYGPPKEEGQIFSVLAPLSLLDSSAPQSPTLNLPRVLSPPPMSAKTTSPGRPSSPSDFHGTPTRRSSAPREPDASSESVFGQHDTWLESASGTFGTSSVSELGNGSDRSRRELSIIDEGDITLNGKKNNQNEGSDDGDDDGDGDEASVKAVKNSLGGKIDGRPIKAANGSS
ncbi:hypothetical protein I308_105968 [Cryptococcus tetragattii IND107]|uniref:Protein IVY1 n=1 Tax=Cryptococcus tetragattii IND107 TaxID=1296105 RepID=A0ABR3BKM9_9TREE|nr:hypothetical protein I308_05683 [Cryptococcus tetragattii IND107]